MNRWTMRIVTLWVLWNAQWTFAEPAKPRAEVVLPSVEIKVPETLAKFEMVKIPGGVVELTTKAGTKEVKVNDFWIARTETTWDVYAIYAFTIDVADERERARLIDERRTRPSRPYGDPHHGFGRGTRPAISVHHQAAARYCEWLSKKTGKTFRLPTEAEWVYACRAGDPLPVTRQQLDAMAWHRANADDQTHPVAEKKPNAWGLHDMLGNVWEWVSTDGDVLAMGGSWTTSPEKFAQIPSTPPLKAWQTDPCEPKSIWWLATGMSVGFRVVIVEEPADKK